MVDGIGGKWTGLKCVGMCGGHVRACISQSAEVNIKSVIHEWACYKYKEHDRRADMQKKAEEIAPIWLKFDFVYAAIVSVFLVTHTRIESIGTRNRLTQSTKPLVIRRDDAEHGCVGADERSIDSMAVLNAFRLFVVITTERYCPSMRCLWMSIVFAINSNDSALEHMHTHVPHNIHVLSA